MNQIKTLEKIWKTGLAILVAATLSIGGLFLSLPKTSAHGSPVMTTRMLVSDVDNPADGWQHNLNSQGGHTVKFYIEIHNTIVGTNTHNVRARVSLPGGVSQTLSVPLTVSADNAASVSDTDTIHVVSPASGGRIEYIPGTTRLTWDENGDGTLDYNQTPVPDGITSGGIRIGDQSGCNEFIIDRKSVV